MIAAAVAVSVGAWCHRRRGDSDSGSRGFEETIEGGVLGLFVSMGKDVPCRSFKLLAQDLEIKINFAK